MKFLAASTFSRVALEITNSLPLSIIQMIINQTKPTKHPLPAWPTIDPYNNMTQIIIPANTNNSIAKVADF